MPFPLLVPLLAAAAHAAPAAGAAASAAAPVAGTAAAVGTGAKLAGIAKTAMPFISQLLKSRGQQQQQPMMMGGGMGNAPIANLNPYIPNGQINKDPYQQFRGMY